MPARNDKKTSARKSRSTKAANRKPPIYEETQYAQRREYLLNWAKESTMSIHLHFNVRHDIDVVEWMKQRRNKQDYIRSLIRADMARCEKEGITPEEREDNENTVSE